MGLGKQLHNLMKQIYFSNYGFSIVLITSLHILLKTKPQYYYHTSNVSFIIKYPLCSTFSVL